MVGIVSIQLSKSDKHIIQIVATPELVRSINRRKSETGLFKEQLFEEAINQLLRPYSYQIGIGHSAFRFLAPIRKSANTTAISFWLKQSLFDNVCKVAQEHGIAKNSITYTACHNYFVLPLITDNLIRK
jgi:hypothetical protein